MAIDTANSVESTPPLAAHPAAELFPLMSEDEFDGLVKDISEHGLLEAITIMPAPDGRILDGRTRYRACRRLGIEPKFVRWDGAGTPEAFVASKNLHRRHLTREQKRELAIKLLKLDPEMSDRQLAKLADVSDKTMTSFRAEAEARSEIPNVDARKDTKGRKQPAKKAKKAKEPKPAETSKAAKPKPAETSTADAVTIRRSASPSENARALIDAMGQVLARDIARKVIEIADRPVKGNAIAPTATPAP